MSTPPGSLHRRAYSAPLKGLLKKRREAEVDLLSVTQGSESVCSEHRSQLAVDPDVFARIAEECGAEVRSVLARVSRQAATAVLDSQLAWADQVRRAATQFSERVYASAFAGSCALAAILEEHEDERRAAGHDAQPAMLEFARRLRRETDWWRKCLAAMPESDVTHAFPLEVRLAVGARQRKGGPAATRVNEAIGAMSARLSRAVWLLYTACHPQLNDPYDMEEEFPEEVPLRALAVRFICAAIAAPRDFGDAYSALVEGGVWERVVEIAGPHAPTVVLPSGSRRPFAACDRWEEAMAPTDVYTPFDLSASRVLNVPGFDTVQAGSLLSVHELLHTPRTHGGLRNYEKEPVHRTIRRWCEESGFQVACLWARKGAVRVTHATYSCDVPVYREASSLPCAAGPVTRLLDSGEEAVLAMSRRDGHLRLVVDREAGRAQVLFVPPA